MKPGKDSLDHPSNATSGKMSKTEAKYIGKNTLGTEPTEQRTYDPSKDLGRAGSSKLSGTPPFGS